jgi:hypothetical protein
MGCNTSTKDTVTTQPQGGRQRAAFTGPRPVTDAPVAARPGTTRRSGRLQRGEVADEGKGGEFGPLVDAAGRRTAGIAAGLHHRQPHPGHADLVEGVTVKVAESAGGARARLPPDRGTSVGRRGAQN